ncbi:hypothetical protein AB6809_29545 [Paraburkholderia sp. RCC_158]|uniref:hypothetical protein n=1 Tax=Paraburkholderia sp. RCC_158 TaxID=3239220 RepID=UPI00352680E8
MTTAATQEQMFHAAGRRVAEVNDTFLELVKDGLTREELARNIERRPSLWARYQHWLPHLPSSVAIHDKPLAAAGLTSYRYKGRYGWMMIGATDHADALREAQRGTDDKVDVENLQVWGGSQYVPVGVTA